MVDFRKHLLEEALRADELRALFVKTYDRAQEAYRFGRRELHLELRNSLDAIEAELVEQQGLLQVLRHGRGG
jgi:hypothetical protein